MTERLPIYAVESRIVAAVRTQRRVLLQAPTGSGKSTQVPQMLLQHGLLGDGQAVVLQPRRLATRMLAARVAHEHGTPLGTTVGYQIRFDSVTSAATRIRFVTEGILLRQMIDQPTLPGVQALVFDEFHERHLYGDITLARALDLQERERPDLAILVMSATLPSGPLAAYLDPCAQISTEGRTFPVTIDYLPHRVGLNGPPVWELAADALCDHIHAAAGGDVLVFMPGTYEIQRTLEALRPLPETRGYVLLPLHGELPPRDQDAAVARYDRPKVVVATNVAETSLTIDGVRLVIDSGLARIARYDPHRGLNTLLIERISQASADQRAGRAGRTAPGHCVRLWSRPEHEERVAHELPEVRRLDLAEVALTLKAAGVTDLRRFRWLEPPAERALEDAETLLADLGALDHTGHVTALGRSMLAFPAHPRYARLLLAAQAHGCVHQAALIAALTQGRDLLIRNPGRDVQTVRDDLFGSSAVSDFWILMRAWTYAARNEFRLEPCRRAGIHAQTARQIAAVHAHFLEIARREDFDIEPREIPDAALQRCILTAFSDRLAARIDQGSLRCEVVHGRRGVLARESAVHHAPLVVVADIREISGADKTNHTLLSLATAVEVEWLRELYPDDFSSELRVAYDPALKRVGASEVMRFRDLVLASRRVEPPPPAAAARALASEIIAGRLALPTWDHAVEQFIVRLNLLARWCPELGLPAIEESDRHHLIEEACQGAVSYKDLKEREVKPIVTSWLSAAQREVLDRHAPERVTLANGRTPRVVYSLENPPHVALRIQELYDVHATPHIAMGRVPVLVHVLAPSMRPVQVTRDLAGFWREHYPRLKQELQRKYPKHEWR